VSEAIHKYKLPEGAGGKDISTAEEAFAHANCKRPWGYSHRPNRMNTKEVKYNPHAEAWGQEGAFTGEKRFLALQASTHPAYKWCEWYPGENYEYWPANKDWLPGRIIMPVEPDHDPVFEEWEWVADAVGPNDIVWVPLYYGSLAGPTPSVWPQRKLPDYGKFVALIQEIAPRVKGILLGNNGCELMFQKIRPVEEDEDGQPITMGSPIMVVDYLGHKAEIDLPHSIHLACEFVAETAPLVLQAGGRPFYGTMDWMIIYDCYNPLLPGRLRQIVNAVNGVHICLCAMTLVPGGKYDRENRLLARGQEQVIVAQEGSVWPPPRLHGYLSGGTFWGDVEGFENANVNGAQLKALGFTELTM